VLASAYFPIFVVKAVCILPRFGMLTAIKYTILLDFSKSVMSGWLCKTDLSVFPCPNIVSDYSLRPLRDCTYNRVYFHLVGSTIEPVSHAVFLQHYIMSGNHIYAECLLQLHCIICGAILYKLSDYTPPPVNLVALLWGSHLILHKSNFLTGFTYQIS